MTSPLFDIIAPAHTDNPTGRAAAESVAHRVGPECLQILRCLARGSGGALIREEIAHLTGIRERACCGRLNELEFPNKKRAFGLPHLSPLVRRLPGTRPARSGIKVIIYELTPAGRAIVEGQPRE